MEWWFHQACRSNAWQHVLKRGEDETRRIACELLQQDVIGHDQSWSSLLHNAMYKTNFACRVQRHGDHAAQYASEECGHPFRAIFSPQNDAVSPLYFTPLEFSGKTLGMRSQMSIAGCSSAIAGVCDYRSLITVAVKIVEQGG
jgi:hypothetical protein